MLISVSDSTALSCAEIEIEINITLVGKRPKCVNGQFVFVNRCKVDKLNYINENAKSVNV